MIPFRGQFSRYSVALIIIIAAFLLRFPIEDLIGYGLPPFILFYPSIMFVAFVLGLGPGLLSTGIAGFLAFCFIIIPQMSSTNFFGHIASLVLFIGMGIFLCAIAHYYRRIRINLENMVGSRTDDLNQTKTALEKQVEEYKKIMVSAQEAGRLAELANVELETIFSAIQDAVLIYDTDMNVRKVNKTFIKKYEFNPLGWNVKEIIKHTRCLNLDGLPISLEDQPTPRALRGETVRNQVLQITCQNGKEAVLETTSTPLYVDGQINGTVTVWHDITEHIQIQEAVQRANEEWERTFDGVPDLIAILDEQHRIIRINRAMCERLNLEAHQCAGLPCYSVIDGTNVPSSICQYSGALTDNSDLARETHESALDSDYLVTSTPLFNSHGNVYATVNVARDITKQKQIEKVLRENEERLELFIKHAPAALAMFDTEMRYLCVSSRWRRDFGLGDRTLIGESHYDVFPEISDEWREAHRRGLAGETIRADADQFERTDGSIQWVRWEIRPWHRSDGNIGGIVIFSEDITNIKNAENINLRYQLLAKYARDKILFVDVGSGKILEANTAAINAYGYSYDEMLQLRVKDLRDSDSQELIDNQISMADLKGITFETVHCRKNGSTFPVEVSSKGAVIGNRRILISVIRNISERKQAEERLTKANNELAERGALLKQILDTSSVAIFLVDTSGRITHANHRMAEIFGWNIYDLIGKEYVELIHPSELELARKNMVALLASKIPSIDLERRYCRADGTEFWGHLSGNRFYDVNGIENGLVGVIADITKRRLAEEELHKKKADIEQFIYTVSHDLRSPLVTVKTFLGYLEHDMAKKELERVSQDLQFIHSAADKMKLLLDELLEMSRIDHVGTPPVRVSLLEVVSEVLGDLAGVISERMVDIKIPETDLMLFGDRQRLCQIWQNLIENSIKYCYDESIPQIELGLQQGAEEIIFFVKDNGIGIDPQYKSKIFGIFEKLDNKSAGAGLGLSMVQRIVEKFGGRIWVESEGIGKGSCFYFTLPHVVNQN